MLMSMRSKNERNESPARLFALSPEAVLGTREGRIVFANHAAERLFGRAVTGESLCALVPELDTAAPEDSFVTAAAIRGTDCAVTAVRWEDFTVWTFRPMKEAPRAVGQAMLSRLRSEAFSLRFSLDRAVTPEVQADPRGQMLFHSYYRLLHLIDQLSDTSALARGELTCREQTVDLGRLVGELADSVRFFTRQRGAEILWLPPEEPCFVSGSPERLEQLVLILLSNALRHTPAGGKIRLGLHRSGKRVVVSLDDSGTGMDQEAMASAFSPREEADLTRADGAGMGLHIAYGIARLHGGAIMLHSRPGEGTSVRLTLPAWEGGGLKDAPRPTAKGPDAILTELADVLGDESYHPRYRD